MAQRALYRLLEHPVFDWIAVAGVVGVHVAVVKITGRFDPLGFMDLDRRLSLYTDVLTVTGILAGFTGAALASYLALNGEGITAVRRQAGPQMTRQWAAALTGPAFAIVLLVVAKVFDDASASGGLVVASRVRFLAELAALLVLVRITRLMWVYVQLVAIATNDAQPGEPPSPVRVIGPKRQAG